LASGGERLRKIEPGRRLVYKKGKYIGPGEVVFCGFRKGNEYLTIKNLDTGKLVDLYKGEVLRFL